MHSTHSAIILVAGRGSRLKELTEIRPKCLLEVGGQSFLGRSLDALSKNGISKVTLVVGYHAEQIRRAFGDTYHDMSIEYVMNENYAETNTAYSLWLARAQLTARTLLMEGDILFEEDVLSGILNKFDGKSVWAAVPVTPNRSEGILLSCNRSRHVSGLKLVRSAQDRGLGLNYKCAGIQLLENKVAQNLALRLDDTIANGEVKKYADLVLGEMLPGISMHLYVLDDMQWAEVDSPDDYLDAQKMFS